MRWSIAYRTRQPDTIQKSHGSAMEWFSGAPPNADRPSEVAKI
jgi:hypothetical protein